MRSVTTAGDGLYVAEQPPLQVCTIACMRQAEQASGSASWQVAQTSCSVQCVSLLSMPHASNQGLPHATCLQSGAGVCIYINTAQIMFAWRCTLLWTWLEASAACSLASSPLMCFRRVFLSASATAALACMTPECIYASDLEDQMKQTVGP